MTKLPILATAVVLATVTGCSSTSPKDLGCLNDLGNAEKSYSAVSDGIANGTSTDADNAQSMKSVQDHLSDLAVVNDQPDIKAKASDGAMHAGRIRVALVSGAVVDSAEVSALAADINALDSACQQAGQS